MAAGWPCCCGWSLERELCCCCSSPPGAGSASAAAAWLAGPTPPLRRLRNLASIAAPCTGAQGWWTTMAARGGFLLTVACSVGGASSLACGCPCGSPCAPCAGSARGDASESSIATAKTPGGWHAATGDDAVLAGSSRAAAVEAVPSSSESLSSELCKSSSRALSAGGRGRGRRKGAEGVTAAGARAGVSGAQGRRKGAEGVAAAGAGAGVAGASPYHGSDVLRAMLPPAASTWGAGGASKHSGA